MASLISKQQTGYIKFMYPEEFDRIEAWINKLRSPSMKMCMRFLMFLGIRESEAVELNINQISDKWDYARIHIKKKKIFTEKIRALPFFLSEELRSYYRRYKKRMVDGYLFFASYANTSKNLHLMTSSIRYKFVQMRKALNMDDVYFQRKDGKDLHRISPHTFRHYFVWKVYKATGNDIVTTRDVIGHVKIETTAKYARSIDAMFNEKSIIEKTWNKSY